MHNVNDASNQIDFHLLLDKIIDALREDVYLKIHFHSKIFFWLITTYRIRTPSQSFLH